MDALTEAHLVSRLVDQIEHSSMLQLSAKWVAYFTLQDRRLESPIEQLFFATWEIQDRLNGMLDRNPSGFCLHPQQPVTVGKRTYRLDFAVGLAAGDWPCGDRVAVELDGHEFHERTKEQVQRRNQRDRDLQGVGWKVFHFSGSEVVRHPVACVDEVWNYCWRAMCEFHRATTAGEGE